MTTAAAAPPTAFPLSWPASWKRTPSHQRAHARFHQHTKGSDPAYSYRRRDPLTVGTAVERLVGELRRLGASHPVISSNLRVRGDGLPYAQQARQLDDPGVAVYFLLAKKPRVLACDRWYSVAENIAAVAGHIEAVRRQERYGVGTIEQAFAGYVSLPPTALDWAIVLGIQPSASRDEINAAHRKLMQTHHPDVGGRHEDMAKINEARDRALAER